MDKSPFQAELEDDEMSLINNLAHSVSSQAIMNASRRLEIDTDSMEERVSRNTIRSTVDNVTTIRDESVQSQIEDSQEKELLKVENQVLITILEAEREKVSLLEADNKAIFDSYNSVKEELHQLYAMTADQHSNDTYTLNLLRSQLQEIKQERDCYKDALSTVKQSISTLMPLIPSPTHSINSTSEVMSSYVTTPTCVVATAHSVDSGLSSQQPSTSRINEGVWPSPPQPDGSIMKTMHHHDVPLPDLSITQINEEQDETIQEHHITYTHNNMATTTAPELSIVRIDQSDSSVVIQSVVPTDIIDEVHGIQAMINHLHQSIDTLVQDNDKTVHESVHQPSPHHHQMEKRKEQQLMVNQELELANEKIETLIKEVEEMKRVNDELVSREVDQVQEQLTTMENELIAQRKLNSELKERREILEIEMAQKLENVNKEKKNLEVALTEKTKQANDCIKLTQQLKVKDEVEDRLQEQLTELQEQLITTQHKLAIEESKNDTNSTLLEKQLYSEQKINEELQVHLNKAISSLETKEQEYHIQEEALSRQMVELKKIVAQKDGMIESIRNDKEKADTQCHELVQQVSTLTDQVNDLHEGIKTSNEHVVKVCGLVEEKDQEIKDMSNEQALLKDTISQLEVESKRHLSAYEQSVVRIQSLEDELNNKQSTLEEREKVIEELTIDNQKKKQMIKDLEEQIKDLEEQLKDRESSTTMVENYQVTVSDLQQKLSEVKQQLLISKETHVHELNQLEEKLQAEYAGRFALIKLQYTERMQENERVENELLNKIALLVPELEKESDEVKRLCKHIDTSKIKQLVKQKDQKLSEMSVAMKELSQNNDSLKSKLAEAKSMIDGLEQSMNRAQITIHQLEEEMKCMVTEKYQLTQQHSEDMKTLTVQLHTCEQLCTTLKDKNNELLLQVQDKDDKNTNDMLLKCLEGERAAVTELTSTLQAKENELVKIADQYIQAKVTADKLQQEIKQLQINQTNEVETLQRDKQHLSEQLKQMMKRKNGVSRETRVLLKKYKQRCASLVFQKKYLSSELDAFYHCHHGALMMIYDSLPSPYCTATDHHRSSKHFKSVALLVLSVVRLKRLVLKKTAPKATPTLLSPTYKRNSGSKLTIVMSKNSK